ncbi:50S ribosomal protein L1 [Candidatus Woesearchaeota archaeon]|nr:50S ribosomal protein L1 [Candidatus Woesearchaeota archaeon]
MDKKTVLEALKKIRADSKKRNFSQSIDLIINLKDINLKNAEEQVDFFATLHHTTGKKKKICALVGPELQDEAKKVCDKTVFVDEFDMYAKDKKLAKKLASEYDYFIAQANIMPKVAAAFGKVFGPKGKMPNPKAGCVVPPKASLKPLYDRLQDTLKISAKTSPLVQCLVGKETLKDEEIADNVIDVYNQLEAKLSKGKNNIKSIFIKFTMGKPERVM